MDKILELARIKKMSNEIGMIADKFLNECQTPIAKLGLSKRAIKTLMRGNIEYVEQLIGVELKDLLKLPNMGIKTANEIKEKIKEFGFDF